MELNMGLQPFCESNSETILFIHVKSLLSFVENPQPLEWAMHFHLGCDPVLQVVLMAV